MGVLSDLVVAPVDSAETVLACDCPSRDFPGLSVKGLDTIKFGTLLSLMSSKSPDADYDRWNDGLKTAAEGGSDGPWVFAFPGDAISMLAGIASLEGDEFEELAGRWGATEEFETENWDEDDLREVLREIGDLAETATLEGKGLYLWICL